MVFILTAMGSLDGVSYALEYKSKKNARTLHFLKGLPSR